MRFHTFLLKYGEIGIKGKNRYLFEDALVRQIRFALKDVDGQFDVHKSQARIYVDCEGDYDYEDTDGMVIPLTPATTQEAGLMDADSVIRQIMSSCR